MHLTCEICTRIPVRRPIDGLVESNEQARRYGSLIAHVRRIELATGCRNRCQVDDLFEAGIATRGIKQWKSHCPSIKTLSYQSLHAFQLDRAGSSGFHAEDTAPHRTMAHLYRQVQCRPGRCTASR